MTTKVILQRRRFIKVFASATAYSALRGEKWVNLLASEIKPLSASSTGALQLRLQDFPALQQESGSVRVGVNPLRGDPPSGPDGQFYPVVINRGANNAFFAVNSRCTHQGCVVDPMDPSTNLINCPCHGSIYSMEGRRISGPATGPLTKYTVIFDGNDLLQVQIPNLGYAVTASQIQAAGGGRIRLDFRAFRHVEYEVHFRESLDRPATAVSFASTADGSLDQTVFTSSTTANASLFVGQIGATGFYVVSMRISEL